MQLSKRLRAVASLVKEGKCVADIGCDHGFTPIYLVKNKIAARAIAMDVGKGPLERAKEHIREYGMEKQIQTRLSDGMKQLSPGEADSVIMSGIGGPLMIRILEEEKETAEQISEFILSPQSEIETVRRFLEAEEYRITDEKMVLEDEKYYTIMRAVHGKQKPYSDLDYRYGKLLLESKDVVLYSYLLKEKKLTDDLIQRLKSNRSARSTERLRDLEAKQQLIKQALERFE